MNYISIENLKVFAHHGVFPEETMHGQDFFVSAKLYLDTTAASHGDCLEKSVNYGDVCHRITTLMQEKTFRLIESAADANDIYSYGFAFTSNDLDDAVKSLADILPEMLKLSETEKACQLMAAEIEKTRRRVNALEHVVIPQTEQNIRYITMKLDENERSTQIRLMKVKDMMLEEVREKSKQQG